MGSGKAGSMVLLLLALEGHLASPAAGAHSVPGVETPQKTLTSDYYCDFDNADRPFCDWSHPADSLWLRENGQTPGGRPGPPEGDIVRRDYYIHPAPGGFARLESPDLNPDNGELCVRFLYYLYGAGNQLSVEIWNASGSVATLWSEKTLQSSSWLSGGVTVPAQAQRPFKVVFKAKQVDTADVMLAVDSIFIQPGPCSPCMTECDFDTPTDLCGWSNPEVGGVIWEPWNGPTEAPGVGPLDDFSRPGFGSYMLLGSFDETSRGSSFLKSPTFSSPGGCLLLRFFYTLHGISDDTALKIYAAAPGGDLGVPLLTLKGEHGPNWRGASANYTGKEEVQFVLEGTYSGKPGLAVDNVAVSPCEGIFATCDFNNNTDPLCGWSESVNNTWKRTNQRTPTEDTGPPGDYPHGEGYYIFAESGHLKPNESTRFSSPPFCTNQEACVEFYYHMHSVVEVEAQLRVLLEGPSGDAVLLWNRTGSQSPSWLYGFVALPYVGAQPSKVTFEVVRGRNAYLDVSLDNLSVHRGYCAGHPATSVSPSTIPTAPPTAAVVTVPQSTISKPTTNTSLGPTTSSISTTTKSTGTKPHATTPVPPITTTKATFPNVTIITGTTSTSKVTTTSQPTNGTSRPSQSPPPSFTTTKSSPSQDAPVPTRNESLTTTPVPPITTTKATLPNVTVPPGTTSTPKLTTTLQPTTGASRPSQSPTLNSTLTSSTISKSSTTQEILTTTPVPPITTTKATLPNVTIITGTTSTPKLTTTLQPTTGASRPSQPPTLNSTLTSSTTSKSSTTQGILTTTLVPPITTSKATLPNVTVPTGTTSTPKVTTTLQPPICTSTPSQPPPPSSTASKSPPPSGPSTAGALLTDPVSTHRPTSRRPATDQTTSGQPPVSASCVVSGDPHYVTYDGRLFHFMGNCTYLLTGSCLAPRDQPAFQIQTANEHRGSNTKVSYLKSVNITVHGTQIVLLKGRRVTVDGKRVTLPVSAAEGRVSVRLSGTYVRIQTDFDVTVRFDGNHHAEVSVPPSYFGKLCGLCGNFNGQATDDNLMPNGTSAGEDDHQLGNSWLVAGTGDASCTNSEDPEKCNPDIAAEAQGPTSCGVLTDPQGPFAPCHGRLPPEGAFESCFYDFCGTGGDAATLCFALQSYADRCAQAGVPVLWRNSTFCPLNCPPGSSYSPCGPACPATCTDPESQDGCPDLPCVEGCVCDQDSVLSGDRCVPLSQCGCTDADGRYHVLGDSWMGDPNCTQRCSCAAGNQITCEEWSCTPVQECRPVEGLLGCQDTGVATCHVAGDPHYYTFDGKMVSFMGTCTYSLVALCQRDLRLPDFNVTAKNEERGQPQASYLRHVTVHIEGATITLQKGRRVLIDGQRVRIPLEDHIPGVSIVPRGIYVVIETNFGLIVKFDGNHHLEIQLPGTYFGKVCGMCGNFNNQSTDDYLMPNGGLAVNDSQFGNSWKAPGDADAGCQPDHRPDLNPNCSRQELERLGASCLEIMAPKFQACHSLVDPKLFFQNCLYDMCQYQGTATVLCDNLQAYVEACKSHGVAHLSWRNSTFCPLPCPPHSHFSECAPPCPASCYNLHAPASCRYPAPCVEGCACDRGYVLSDLVCVPMRECGCRGPQQEYHNAGDTWVTSGCQQQCACLDGQIRCQPFGCQTGSQCTSSSQGLHYCRPSSFHRCVVLGDPHYRTFDNFVHHFQGRCTYTLTRTMGRVPVGLEPLSVAGRNHRRSIFHHFSFLREVYVEVLGFRITLMQGRKMAVNGVMVIPPYSPAEGLQISQRGRRLIVETDFGFSVSYDGYNAAEIVLPATYQQRVGGLCGNYDGRRNNEYMKPDGTWTRILNTFGNSWKVTVGKKGLDGGGSGHLSPARVRREEPDEEPESGFEMDCAPEQLAIVNGSRACGALSDPAGPFSACHAKVPPAPFQESCVYDLCALFNDTELLCQDLEAYAQLCQEQQADVALWRQKTGCSMECPAHTSYQPCMSACPASCANLAAPSDCQAPCVEGCASGPGYVLSGPLAVPYHQCGCSSHGQYYQLNETFLTEDCGQRCTCRQTGLLECEEARCGPEEVCALSGYVRGCFRDDACLSAPCQNEGECQLTPGGFRCLCLEGYVGTLCEDSPLQDPTTADPSISPTTGAGDPHGPDLLVILLAVFIPLVVILLVTIVVLCVFRQRDHGYRMKLEEDHLSFTSTTAFSRF